MGREEEDIYQITRKMNQNYELGRKKNIYLPLPYPSNTINLKHNTINTYATYLLNNGDKCTLAGKSKYAHSTK